MCACVCVSVYGECVCSRVYVCLTCLWFVRACVRACVNVDMFTCLGACARVYDHSIDRSKTCIFKIFPRTCTLS